MDFPQASGLAHILTISSKWFGSFITYHDDDSGETNKIIKLDMYCLKFIIFRPYFKRVYCNTHVPYMVHSLDKSNWDLKFA